VSRGRRLARAAGLTRNPMLRATDRVEFAARALLILIFLVVAVPASFVVGTLAHDNSKTAASAGVRQVPATVRALPADASAAYARARLAEVAWTAPDGALRTGHQAVPVGTRTGDTVPVWTDPTGRLTTQPPTADDQVFTGILVGGLTAAAAAGVLAVTMVVVRYRVDRRRYERWDAEWNAVGPDWCRH
jgi:hypothetical protein